MLSITKLSILSKPKGAMDEILNNEKQVVLLLKGSVRIQLSVLANNEPSPLSCPLSLLCFAFCFKSTLSKVNIHINNNYRYTKFACYIIFFSSYSIHKYCCIGVKIEFNYQNSNT